MEQQIREQGFTIVNDIYTAEEVKEMLTAIHQADSSRSTFRQTDDLFAIRQVLKEIRSLSPIIFNYRLKTLIKEVFGGIYFVVKSIYFDKPGKSNWFVAWHQDLTISVKEKTDVEGYGPWTVKQDQYAVQPPLSILEQNFTIRIHLDDTNDQNGALKVVPGSHKKGIYRPETINWQEETAVSCPVPQGGIMIMKPLLLHASGRTLNEKNRRVLHIEFSQTSLPEPLQWAEKTTTI